VRCSACPEPGTRRRPTAHHLAKVGQTDGDPAALAGHAAAVTAPGRPAAAAAAGSAAQGASFDALQQFTHLIGGGGVYEQVVFTTPTEAAGQALVFRTTSGERDLFSLSGLSEDQVLGVDSNGEHMPYAPYTVVDPGHPFLAGTGLVEGSTFAATGYNGPVPAGRPTSRPRPCPRGPRVGH
jgi:hypothetical protein